MDKYLRINQQRRVEDNERLINNSYEALLQNLENKILTTGIGGISKFEAFFGKVWGMGLADDKLSDSQRQWKAVWEQCRDEILNHTNHIRRSMKKVLSPYEIKWIGYKMTFKNNGR